MMTIYYDSRQQYGKHDTKHKQLEQLGYTLERRKLDYGDYMFEGNASLSVDTKQDVDELCSNLIQDKGRFRREIVGAYEHGIKLIILIEDDSVSSLDELKYWIGNHSRVNGSVLYDKAMKLHYAYGVEFMFCKKEETGKKIVELLLANTRRNEQS